MTSITPSFAAEHENAGKQIQEQTNQQEKETSKWGIENQIF
ncbi:hypothetical protein [Bacillus cereus]|nr:hypothetical protein [Bacillus cereus]